MEIAFNSHTLGRVEYRPSPNIHTRKLTANIESSGGFHPSRGRAGIHPIFFGRIVGWRKIPVGYPIYCAGLVAASEFKKKGAVCFCVCSV